MAAPAKKAEPASREALLRAALAAFAEHGYHGTSMREVALRAGTAVSHAYYYFPAKADLLRTLMVGVTEDLIAALRAANAAAGPDPAARLAALVRAHVRLHCERQAESFIGNSELRSLSPADRDMAVGLRDQVARLFDDAIQSGKRENLFACPHPHEAMLAIVTMCTAVAGWYRADGELTPDALADRYAELALSMVAMRV